MYVYYLLYHMGTYFSYEHLLVLCAQVSCVPAFLDMHTSTHAYCTFARHEAAALNGPECLALVSQAQFMCVLEPLKASGSP